MLRRFLVAYIATFSLIMSSCAQQPPTIGGDDRGIFYRISGNGMEKASYILGSYHVVPGDFVWTLPQFDSIMQGVKLVVCEKNVREFYDDVMDAYGPNTELLDEAFLGQLEMVYARPDGTYGSFIDDLPQRNQDFCRRVLPNVFGFYDPAQWNSAYVLRNINAQAMELMQVTIEMENPSLKCFTEPIDMYMVDSVAPRYGIAVAELDDDNVFGIKANMPHVVQNLLNGTSRKNYSYLTYNVIYYYYTQLKEISRSVPGYLKHDAAFVDKLQMTPQQEKTVIADRNALWMNKLTPMLREEGPMFIVVGLAHLHDRPSSAGLLTRLERMGYKIEKM